MARANQIGSEIRRGTSRRRGRKEREDMWGIQRDPTNGAIEASVQAHNTQPGQPMLLSLKTANG
jgi:hypothetical protein